MTKLSKLAAVTASVRPRRAATGASRTVPGIPFNYCTFLYILAKDGFTGGAQPAIVTPERQMKPTVRSAYRPGSGRR